MKRLTGGIDKNGKFVLGLSPHETRHCGFKEENREMQRITHVAELVQMFTPDGKPNPFYTTIYHDAAIRQGLIDEDPQPNFQKFE